MVKPIEIEVFRADDRASRGITSSDIADLATAYDPEANPVPVVIGHPKNDTPAKGLVAGFRAEGNKLFAKLDGLKDDLIDGVKSGELLNRSMAFFGGDHESNPTPGKLAPRHLGFLGGSAPGIPGLSPLKKAFEFNAEDDILVVEGPPADAIVFSSAPTKAHNVTEEPSEMSGTPKKSDDKPTDDQEFIAREQQLADDKKRLEDERKEFAAQQKAARTSANKTRVDGLVAAGRVLPADKDALAMVFDALDDGELEFAADDKGTAGDKLTSILMKGPKLVDDSGKALTPKKGEFSADDPKAAAQLTARAKELQKDDASLTFTAAIEAAQKEMEG